mmetsp:Transcript_25820/g.74703  ORF Transcript_25820/g.74703 Transcript_25820/m.74703 type:complete len:246 (-) Transcript_25820:492-1229(-)
MQLGDALLERQYVLILASYVCICRLDGICNTTGEDGFPVQRLSSTLTSHDHVHILIRRVGLDNLHLPRHLLFDIRLVLLLRVLIQLHFVNEFTCQSVAQIFSNSHITCFGILLLLELLILLLEQGQQILRPLGPLVGLVDDGPEDPAQFALLARGGGQDGLLVDLPYPLGGLLDGVDVLLDEVDVAEELVHVLRLTPIAAAALLFVLSSSGVFVVPSAAAAAASPRVHVIVIVGCPGGRPAPQIS